MVKKIYIILACMIAAASLTACSNESSGAKKEPIGEKVTAERNQKQNKNNKVDSSKGPLVSDRLVKENIGDIKGKFQTKINVSSDFPTLNFNLKSVDASIIKLKEEQVQFFDDQEEIGAISVKASVVNTSSEQEVTFNGNAKFAFQDGTNMIADIRYSHFSSADPLKPGEGSLGYFVFIVPKDKLMNMDTGTLTVEAPYVDQKPDGNDLVLTIPLSSQGTKKISSQVFADKITAEQLGVKDILFTKKNMNLRKTTGAVEVGINNIQTTRLKVNEAHKQSLDNLPVLNSITMEVSTTNKGKEALNVDLGACTLFLDERLMISSANTLSDRETQGEIKPGESRKGYVVFLLHPDDFKDAKNVSVKFQSPMRLDFSKIAEDVTFQIPVK
jgi:hypothetical protein